MEVSWSYTSSMDFKIISSLSVFLIFDLLAVFGLPTKLLDPEIVYARHGQSITLPCSAFEKALQLKGDHVCYVRWSNRTYDGVETQWVPFAMMNGDGGIQVDGDPYKRFNITTDDGGLRIHEVQPRDNQTFMCSVVFCSGRSPLKSYVTLKVSDEKENPTTEKPKPSEAATTRGSKKPEKVEIKYPYRGAFIVAITIAAISIFGNVVLAFLLYRVRGHRSTN